MSCTTESLRTHSRPFRPLSPSVRVFLQTQQGLNPNKWDRSGVVVESLGHDQYRVKVDGSGRLTLCNRRFLRSYMPATPYAPLHYVPPSPPPVASECQPLPVLHSGDGPLDVALGSPPSRLLMGRPPTLDPRATSFPPVFPQLHRPGRRSLRRVHPHLREQAALGGRLNATSLRLAVLT